jgi:hypothetical protein
MGDGAPRIGRGGAFGVEPGRIGQDVIEGLGCERRGLGIAMDRENIG